MIDDAILALRDLSQPEGTERTANLVSVGPNWAELEVTDGGAPISGGTLLGIQTSKTIYVGHVESGEMLGETQRFRVRVDHWLALQDVSSIQKLWSQEQPD